MRFQSGKKGSTPLSILILTTTFLQSTATAVDLLKRVNPVEKSVSDDSFELNNCVSDIVKRRTVEPNNIVMISGMRPYWIPSVFRNRSVYIVQPPITNIPESFKYESYVMIMLDTVNVQDAIRILAYLKKLHPRAFCLVRWYNSRDAGLNIYLEAIAHYLTSIGRTAVIIATHYSHGTGKSLRLYRYSNYTEANCDKVSLIDYGDCSKKETLDRVFPKIMNMNQCPLKIKLISVPHNTEIYEKNCKMKIRGYEWDLLKFIVQNINATSHVIPQSFNDTSGSGETRLSVINGKVDIGCGLLLQYNMEKIIYTVSYEILETCIIMPKKDPQQVRLNMFVPYEWKVWLTFFSTMTVEIIITWMMPTMRKTFSVWIIITILFGVGNPKAVKPISFRIYFFVLAICGYILNQSYLASLTGIVAKPKSPTEMQTLKELEDSNYPIHGVNTIRLQLKETNPKLYQRFKTLSINEFFVTLNQVMAGRKKLAIHATSIQIRFRNAPDSDIKFHTIPEKIGFYPTAMLLPETSVILTSFNRLIYIAVENGLFDYWKMKLLMEEREENLIYRKSNVKNATNGEALIYKGITITYLQSSFFLLAIGASISLLVFIAELIVGSKNVSAHRECVKATRPRRLK